LLGDLFGDLDTVTISASRFSCPRLPLYLEPDRSRAGKIRSLHIDLRDFQEAGLEIASLTADIPDCRFDFTAIVRRREFALTGSGVGTCRVRIAAGALAAFAMKKFPQLSDVSVRIDKDRLFVDGSARLLLLSASFSVIAGLRVVDGRRLVVDSPTVFIDGHGTDPQTVRSLTEALSPLVDLDKDLGLCGAVDVQGMTLRDGVLEAWGTATLPANRQPQTADHQPQTAGR
jgi:hypothetical protein